MLSTARIRLVFLISVCALAISALSFADSPPQIDIPAGELTVALQQLAWQTGVEFVYSAEEIKGVHTQGAHGKLTAKEAVSKLLEGTKLQLTIHGSGAFLIAYPHTSSLSTLRRTQCGYVMDWRFGLCYAISSSSARRRG
jgi:hypothetical protein